MTVDRGPRFGRADVLIDRATRIVRLLAWLAMFVLCCLMLWVMARPGGAGRGPEGRRPRDRPRRATTAAGAIARDAAKAAAVPGYAGTDVPERSLTAAAWRMRPGRGLAVRTIRAGRPGARWSRAR